MERERAGDGTVKSADTVLSVLELLKEHEGLRVTEVAELLGVSKSTAHRYLKTLHRREYVRNEGGQYRVGLRFLSLGMHARMQQSSYPMIREKVDQLAEETGERVQFIVPEHDKAVYLYRAMGDRAVRINSEIGDRVPLHVLSPGKAILAVWPDQKVRAYIEKGSLEEFTERTITDPQTLLTELEVIRERNYSYNREEFVAELNAVGIAISDPRGRVLGAIGVSGPTHRMTGSRLQSEIPDLLLGTAHEIEVNLKYSS